MNHDYSRSNSVGSDNKIKHFISDLEDAVSALSEIELDKSEAILSVVRAREKTNWKALLFLLDVYSNKPVSENSKLMETLSHQDLNKVFEHLPEEEVGNFLRKLVGLNKM